MRDNARKGYAREHASFDPGYCSSIQSLPGQFHDDNGDALSLSDDAAPLLRGVGMEVIGKLGYTSGKACTKRRLGGFPKATGTGRAARTKQCVGDGVANVYSDTVISGDTSDDTGPAMKRRARKVAKKKYLQKLLRTDLPPLVDECNVDESSDDGSVSFDRIREDVSGHNSRDSDRFLGDRPLLHEFVYVSLEPSYKEVKATEVLLRLRKGLQDFSDSEGDDVKDGNYDIADERFTRLPKK